MIPAIQRCKGCGLLMVYGDAYESRVLEKAERLYDTRNPWRWVRLLVAMYREVRSLKSYRIWSKPPTEPEGK